MSDFIDDLDSLIGKSFVSPNKCKVWLIMNNLQPDEAAKLNELINNTSVSANSISKILYQNKHFLSGAIVSRHRRRSSGTGCACP